jgi:integrase/recombinase XerD
MPHLAPPTLTAAEQKAILRATAGNVRDHTIISMALGTGLRLAELVGLNVGDVFALDGTPRVRVRIRPEIAKGGRAADVFTPDRLVAKLRRFWAHKRLRREGLDPVAPLFCNQSRRRISRRRAQFAWRTWQRKAGFDRLYPFHVTRHSAVTAVYRATHDLFLAQRFARHLSPLTTGSCRASRASLRGYEERPQQVDSRRIHDRSLDPRTRGCDSTRPVAPMLRDSSGGSLSTSAIHR